MTTLSRAGLLAAAAVLWSAGVSAQTVQMVATLTSGEETPAFLSGAAGSAVVSVDTSATVGRDIIVELRLFNLPAGTTAGHIHIGPRGIAGPVVIDFPIPAGRTGDLSLDFRVGAAAFRPRPEIGINTFDDAVQAILLGNAYVNVHTSANPSGEIRGQLTRRN